MYPSSKSLKYLFNSTYLRLISGLFLLVIYYIFIITLVSENNDFIIDVSNIIGPLIFSFLVCRGAYTLLKSSPVTIWTPVVAYLLSSALFFGLGPLVYEFGNQETQEYLQRHILLSITSLELLKTNLLNAVGTLSTSGTIFVLSGVKQFQMPSNNSSNSKHSYKLNLSTVGIFFLALGFILRYFFILPHQYGLTSYILPGVVNNLGQLIDLGLTIVAYLACKQKGPWKIILLTILPLHGFSTLLEFKKSSLIISLLLPTLGAYAASGKLKKLSIRILAIALLYFLSQPYVHYGRDMVEASSGSKHQATIQQRYKITKDFFEQGNVRTVINEDSKQSGWTRLSYSGPQSFVMDEYDSGRPGSTLKDAWIVFVPRILWPSKPVGIGPGKMFYKLATGHDRQARVGVTVYGDAYWQGGWVGLVVLSGLMGAVFLLMSRFSLIWITRGELIYLPSILISIQMALLGTTGFFINKIFGALPIYFAYIFAIKMFLVLFIPKRNYQNDFTSA